MRHFALFCSTLVLFLSGCQTTPTSTPTLKPGVIQNAATDIDTNRREIEKNALGIMDDVANAVVECPDLPQLPAINAKASLIVTLTELIGEKTAELTALGKQVDAMSGDISRLKRENEELKAKIASGERKFLLWLYGISIVVVIGGVVLTIFVTPRVVGLAVIALGLIGATVAKVFLSYAAYVYLGTGVAVLGILGYLAYRHFVLGKDIFNQDRVLDQVMDTVSALKPTVPPEVFDDAADRTQDSDVQNFINRLRFERKLQ